MIPRWVWVAIYWFSRILGVLTALSLIDTASNAVRGDSSWANTLPSIVGLAVSVAVRVAATLNLDTYEEV